MALHELKRLDEARAVLAKCKESASTKRPSLDILDLGVGWRDVLIANILLREAETLMGHPLAGGSQKEPSSN